MGVDWTWWLEWLEVNRFQQIQGEDATRPFPEDFFCFFLPPPLVSPPPPFSPSPAAPAQPFHGKAVDPIAFSFLALALTAQTQVYWKEPY